MKTLQLIVPCFNEAEVLPLFYDETAKVLTELWQYDCGFLFVDDGSADDTLRVIKALAQRDERVKYLSFSRNFGKESAMLAGLRASTADYVAILDADLQHSPALLPQMLSALEDGYDVAAAKRVDRKGEGRLKSRLSDRFYAVANRMMTVELDAGAQDFRVMKRAVVDAVLSMTEHRRFSKGIFSFVGFKTKWFPHENRSRAAGKTKWSIKKLWRYAMDGILAFSDLPLKLPLWFGSFAFCGGLIYGLVMLILLLCGRAAGAVHTVVCVLLLCTGAVLLSVGVLGVYLARVYGEVKHRPDYIIREQKL
ncbi:MAG: glycosyltransferase family 2 protein [Clostridia bacterium]|nr:glycosyltransferase family 2 protein [Clostridia bacterium]